MRVLSKITYLSLDSRTMSAKLLLVTRNRKPCLTEWNNNQVCCHRRGSVDVGQAQARLSLEFWLLYFAGFSALLFHRCQLWLSLAPIVLSVYQATVTGKITPWSCLIDERYSFLQLLDTWSSLQSSQAKLLMDSILNHWSQDGKCLCTD